MKILVVGGGGREHAIIMKLAESPQVDALYCAPGNGGIAKYAECFPVKATDIDGIVALAKKLGFLKIDYHVEQDAKEIEVYRYVCGNDRVLQERG